MIYSASMATFDINEYLMRQTILLLIIWGSDELMNWKVGHWVSRLKSGCTEMTGFVIEGYFTHNWKNYYIYLTIILSEFLGD